MLPAPKKEKASKGKAKAVDASADAVYTRLGNVYPFASPSYIRDEMSEAQVFAYLSRINFVQEQAAKPLVYRLAAKLAEFLSALFVGKKVGI